MPSVFISYAHDDQEFALALIKELQAKGINVRYDQVILYVGDSLIERLATEIVEGDFLVAIVSPDSVNSAWCRKELSIAQVHGIDQKRVKVLPVRYRRADMPPMLIDTFWSDADVLDVATVAEELSDAIRAHLEGRVLNSKPSLSSLELSIKNDDRAEAESTNQRATTQIDEVADKTWDVIAEWERRRHSGGATVELEDRKRRLRWALDSISESIRVALPSVVHLSEAGWNEFYRVADPANVESDLREELRSVRNQVVQGLSLGRRWMIRRPLGEVDAGNRDALAYQWEIARGDETRRVKVFISGTVAALSGESLPRDVVAAKRTRGRSVAMTLVALDDPPLEVMVTTVGISWPLPDWPNR